MTKTAYINKTKGFKVCSYTYHGGYIELLHTELIQMNSYKIATNDNEGYSR